MPELAREVHASSLSFMISHMSGLLKICGQWHTGCGPYESSARSFARTLRRSSATRALRTPMASRCPTATFSTLVDHLLLTAPEPDASPIPLWVKQSTHTASYTTQSSARVGPPPASAARRSTSSSPSPPGSLFVSSRSYPIEGPTLASAQRTRWHSPYPTPLHARLAAPQDRFRRQAEHCTRASRRA